MKRPALSILAGLLLASAPTLSQALDTVTVGVVNSSSDVAFYIAAEFGYFKAEGIDPKFERFDSAARMIAPLGAGQLDVGAGAVGAGLYNAVERGIDIKIVADKAHCEAGQSYVTLLVRKALIDSGEVKSFADLKGRKIALAGAGTGDSSTLDDALKKGGAAGFADADVVYLGFSQQAAALQSGAIDAAIMAEPSVTLAVESGSAVRFAGAGDITPHQQTAVILYAGSFGKSRPDVAKRFMKAYIRAVRDYNEALQNGKLTGPKGEAVLALVKQNTSVKDDRLLRSMVPHAVNRDGAPNLTSLEKDHGFFVRNGLVPERVTVASVVEDSFRNAALAELVEK